MFSGAKEPIFCEKRKVRTVFLRQLTYLVALDRHRHFARAAESCNVSQPALSAGISELERELGIAIIKRNRSFQGITPAGERVLNWARQVLSSLDGLRQEADLIRTVPGGHLAIGTVPSTVCAVTLLTAEFRRLIPNLTLDAASLSAQEILHRLKRQDLHLGITYRHLPGMEECETLPLYQERYVLVSDGHASLGSVLTWQEAATLPLCLFSQEMQNRRIIDQAFREIGVHPNIVQEGNTIELLVSPIRSGGVVGIMPASVLHALPPEAGLHIHSIIPERLSLVSLVRLRRDIQPPLTEAVWQLARRLDLQGLLDAPVEGRPT